MPSLALFGPSISHPWTEIVKFMSFYGSTRTAITGHKLDVYTMAILRKSYAAPYNK